MHVKLIVDPALTTISLPDSAILLNGATNERMEIRFTLPQTRKRKGEEEIREQQEDEDEKREAKKKRNMNSFL